MKVSFRMQKWWWKWDLFYWWKYSLVIIVTHLLLFSSGTKDQMNQWQVFCHYSATWRIYTSLFFLSATEVDDIPHDNEQIICFEYLNWIFYNSILAQGMEKLFWYEFSTVFSGLFGFLDLTLKNTLKHCDALIQYFLYKDHMYSDVIAYCQLLRLLV